MSKKDLNSIYKTQPKKKSLFKKTQLAVAGLMTAVTVISTVHFDTSEYRNGEQNPLSFAKDVSMKVSETINPTVEAAEVGSSVNDADLQLKGFENAEVFDMTKLADPTGQKDSSEVFHNILQKSVDAPIVLNLGDGNYKFDSTHNIEVLGSKGVKIIGNGATIDYLNAKTTNLPEFYAFQFHMKRGDNIGVQIEGVTFDAHRNEQNMFFTFNNEHLDGGYGGDVSSFYKTRLAKGVLISHAEDVSVSNTNFKNAYGGYSLILEGYRHVNYKNINVDNVGGDGQTDSLGMIFYFSGHTFDDAVINMDNMQVEGKVGDKPQSNAGSGFSNPGDESYMSWIGIVVENGTIQSTNKDNWLEDKNTTLNVTNSKFNNFENVYHVESMAGNIAVNMNNIKSRAKQIGISAGIKGKYRAVLNKMDHIQEPWGRNNTYSSLFSSEFGDDPRYHNGYNANLTDANGGEALHQTLMTNSKVTYTERPKSPAGAKGSADVYAGIAYGNMVTANIECSQLDGLWNKAYANGGGYMKDSVVNLWKDNPNDATLAGIKGDPGLNTVNWDNVTVNKAGSWTNVPQTCATPTFNNFSGTESLGGLDSAVTPAPIGGGTTTPPQNLAPIISLSDITIEEGTTFDPLKDVSVTDDHDVNLPLDVKGTVDTSKPGEYTLTYTAKDSGDAVATVTRKVTVTPKATTPTTEAPTTEAP
ncbi:immunoglobulin-like domain-containing protein, partial [Macrococcus sp. PK]|uniref:immunoglobulin-like domain-containing protein n=1 Tax=Macrococcus sp. PK TaxID=2801919 RepID=UPI001F0EED1B